MSLFKSLSKNPITGPLVQKGAQIVVNFKAKKIAGHFSEYLKPMVAYDNYYREQAFKIRHEVYCEELGFEECREDGMETDEADPHSILCLIQHRKTQRYAGTCRVVYSRSDEQLLPIEKYCLDSIDVDELSPTNFPRNKICEISRLAVPEEFRRRQADKFKGAATGAINEAQYSDKELRCFPFIAVGLYLSAASVVINKDIEHVYVMMEPRLARSLRFVGIAFKQVGPVVDYHGKRAPYYINPEMLLNSLTPGFKKLFKNIKKDLDIEYAGRSDEEDGLVVVSNI